MKKRTSSDMEEWCEDSMHMEGMVYQSWHQIGEDGVLFQKPQQRSYAPSELKERESHIRIAWIVYIKRNRCNTTNETKIIYFTRVVAMPGGGGQAYPSCSTLNFHLALKLIWAQIPNTPDKTQMLQHQQRITMKIGNYHQNLYIHSIWHEFHPALKFAKLRPCILPKNGQKIINCVKKNHTEITHTLTIKYYYLL